MRLTFYSLVIICICLSCNSNGGKTAERGIRDIAKADSLHDSDSLQKIARYIQKAHLQKPDYSVNLVSRYFLPADKSEISDSDQYFAGDYLIFQDKKKNAPDTLQLTVLYPAPNILKDLTDSLKFPWPLFQVVTSSDDLFYDDNFVIYKNGELKEAFFLEDYDSIGIHLRRKDDRTLCGLMGIRDELVYNYENDYPFTVDINTFKVTHITPAQQYIGYHTIANEDIKAHMVINGRVDDKLYDLHKGDSVIVDTLYRNLKKVRLKVSNDVLLEIKVETADKKIQKLMAG